MFRTTCIPRSRRSIFARLSGNGWTSSSFQHCAQHLAIALPVWDSPSYPLSTSSSIGSPKTWAHARASTSSSLAAWYSAAPRTSQPRIYRCRPSCHHHGVTQAQRQNLVSLRVQAFRDESHAPRSHITQGLVLPQHPSAHVISAAVDAIPRLSQYSHPARCRPRPLFAPRRPAPRDILAHKLGD